MDRPIVVRFRRSRGEERQQLKWFLAAMAPAAVLLPLSLSELGVVFPIVNLLSAATLPVAGISVAIAILRYRLYDIDRIISRTISYGLITGLLIMVFLLVNLGLQWLLSSVTSGNSLAVAGSTLLAAALFTPVRSQSSAWSIDASIAPATTGSARRAPSPCECAMRPTCRPSSTTCTGRSERRSPPPASACGSADAEGRPGKLRRHDDSSRR